MPHHVDAETIGMSTRDWAIRIMAEFNEQPGMRLTLLQASRLWQVHVERCDTILRMLVEHGRLTRTPNGHYMALSRV